jgi:hypothetical protein
MNFSGVLGGRSPLTRCLFSTLSNKRRIWQDWEAGVRTPPDYIVRLLPYKLMLEWDYDNKRPKELKKPENE